MVLDEVAEDKMQLKYFMMGGYTPVHPNVNNRIDYFIKRGQKMKYLKPYQKLDALARHIESYYPLRVQIKHKARHAELVDARRMFIFFATIYLGLTSTQIAKYLNCERSTLSHHLYKATANIRMYEYDRVIAHSIDQFMETMQNEMD